VLVRQHRDHHPAAGLRVPEDLRIAEVLPPEVEHRVPRVLREGPAPVAADRQVLGLPRRRMPGVDATKQPRPPQRPLVSSWSTITLPEKTMTPASSRKATGRCVQWRRSGLTACPQLMCPQRSPSGLCW
jgi:hypothetical protein